ncbi:MAG: tetratricopeptide repeat protein [Candidatus Poribacteria bacterium]|nr:tetratricopeptide repeat protein [Candidatus Poribacteria bacterium]
MYKKNFGLIAFCGLISILFANVSFAESEVDECIAPGEEKLRKAIEVREKSQEELQNETIDEETYEKRCNEAINQALSVFDRAIAANPENPDFHYQRGLAMVKWNKLDTDAHEYFDKAIELNPFYVEAYYQKGLLFREWRKIEEAIKQLDEVIFWKPDFGDAYFHRGSL